MILDVKLIKNSSIYCAESALATVATWLKRDYRMMFSGMLGFSYTEKGDFVSLTIGERIKSGISMENIVCALRYYHGIEAEIKRVDKNVKEIVSRQINQKMPVLTYIASYLCEWTEEKQGEVYFLIIGYDKFFVYGYDLHDNSDHVKKLPINKLEENYVKPKELQIYRIVDNEKDVEFEEVKKIIQDRYDLTRTSRMVEKMANDLLEGYAKEFVSESYVEFRYMPIFKRLIDVVRGKKLFAETCYYIAERTGDEFAKYVGDCYIDIGEQWNIAWNMLAKAYLIESNENIERKIGKIIKETTNRMKNAAEMEKKIIVNVFGECQIKEKVIKVSNKIEEDRGFQYIDINITDFFDNKAFSEHSMKISANMTGHGEFFKAGELPKDRIIRIGKTGFYINASYDNLTCNNQVISIRPDRYKKIYILGCAEWGDGSGKVQVGNDNYAENLWLEFPDWYYCKMNIGNGWRGKAVDYEGNEVDRGLFCLDYELNEKEIISWIRLPVVKNIHIFGIQLLK